MRLINFFGSKPILATALAWAMAVSAFAKPLAPVTTEVCVYGATPSGILAALAVQREGRAVVIVEPSRWVGGMLGAGLKPMQDCPNYAATGGMTRDLLKRLGQPQWEGDQLVRSSLSHMSPLVVREDFSKLLQDRQIKVIFEHRIARCEKRDAKIQTATFDLAPFDDLGCPVAEPAERAHLQVSAKIFIDASYEGDLLAEAGVAWRVGRESKADFGEEYAGIQPPMEVTPIDPFVKPGQPESGLLKFVESGENDVLGAGDKYTQAYNYRYYTTDDPTNRVPITPPPSYQAADFELVGRYVAYLTKNYTNSAQLFTRLTRIYPGWMNSAEWNYHRESLFSMAPVGISHLYAAGDYAAKTRVWKEHQNYLRGLHTFMSTDPRVPEDYRKRIASLGLDGRFHPETHGWPHQLYVRVARRMEGAATITAHDVYNKTQVADPVGLAQYGIDVYPTRRIWFKKDGQFFVALEGKMFVGGGRGPTSIPYPIPYRAITPKADQCANLLVPVCFSGSHLGYASARMEPVFMICGESAGIAACRALAEGVAVQAINPAAYRQALEQAKQKLVWDAPPQAPEPPHKGRPLNVDVLLKECDRNHDGQISRAEWNDGKPNFDWLFDFIDKDKNGQITPAEYQTFQEYKTQHPDWQKTLRPEKK